MSDEGKKGKIQVDAMLKSISDKDFSLDRFQTELTTTGYPSFDDDDSILEAKKKLIRNIKISLDVQDIDKKKLVLVRYENLYDDIINHRYLLSRPNQMVKTGCSRPFADVCSLLAVDLKEIITNEWQKIEFNASSIENQKRQKIELKVNYTELIVGIHALQEIGFFETSPYRIAQLVSDNFLQKDLKPIPLESAKSQQYGSGLNNQTKLLKQRILQNLKAV